MVSNRLPQRVFDVAIDQWLGTLPVVAHEDWPLSRAVCPDLDLLVPKVASPQKDAISGLERIRRDRPKHNLGKMLPRAVGTTAIIIVITRGGRDVVRR